MGESAGDESAPEASRPSLVENRVGVCRPSDDHALILAETTASFTLQAGATRLRFQEAQHDVLYHVAFTIPRNTFTEAKSWLHKHVSLRNSVNFGDSVSAELGTCIKHSLLERRKGCAVAGVGVVCEDDEGRQCIIQKAGEALYRESEEREE
jgi:hypothetical protein